MKPSLPKGTRDFLPEQVRKRNFIFDTIKDVFIKYGYAPIETPAMENLSTLSGKYGEEGDKLLFKVLNNGDFLAKADETFLREKASRKVLPSISKRGLRYDLTVPFARYVVMHQNDISFPFKRYQIQPVWRADRPQKGRYQEFYQCDADVVGSPSLLYEAELIMIYDEVFRDLGLPVTIQVNNRKILFGIAEEIGKQDQFMAMTIAIDKLDKIGIEGVSKELENEGFTIGNIDKIKYFLSITTIDELEKAFDTSDTGKFGVEELKKIYTFLDGKQLSNQLVFDIKLARGLSYYTGCILEVKADNADMGSIGGGGRYDDLTSIFGMKEVSGVGISFGAARIFDVMEEKDLFPTNVSSELNVLFLSYDNESLQYAFNLVSKLRNNGISADIYPEAAKMKKQMKYANARRVPYIIVIGSNEIENESFVLKEMETGKQTPLSLEELIHFFQ